MPREKKNQETPAEALPTLAAETALVTPSEPDNPPPAVLAEPPSRQAPAPIPKKPSQVGRAFVFLFKLIVFLALLGGIGAALYFGLPIVYDKYILPVQQNTAKLAALETQQAQTNQQLADLQTQVTALQAQIQAGAAEQSRQTQALEKLTDRVDTLENGIKVHTQTLATLEAAQTSLREQNQTTSAELDRQIQLLKSMELLSRARLFLYQSNFGLAKVDLQAARSLLAEVQPEAPAPLAQELTEVLQRLDLTLGNLPNFPVAASDDLDIAWQVLLQGLPATTATPVPTTVPEATVTPAPTATP
jgi:hypothetical protein